jgi:hypothetical protein
MNQLLVYLTKKCAFVQILKISVSGSPDAIGVEDQIKELTWRFSIATE